MNESPIVPDLHSNPDKPKSSPTTIIPLLAFDYSGVRLLVTFDGEDRD